MIIYMCIQLLVILALAPLVNGIIKKIKALVQKREGAPFLQLYRDLYKLFRKQMVISETASWLYFITPYVFFASVVVAAVYVPVLPSLPGSFAGDGIMLVYILVLGRIFMILAGLDTASAFGGMGSSREALISALAEPTLLISIFTVSLIAKSTSVLEMMLKTETMGFPMIQPVFIMSFLALLIVLLMETSRIPVDDPATHLELTMVHEAMLLEYSGRHLALMTWGASIKQLVLMTFLVNVFMPHGGLMAYLGLSGMAAMALSLVVYVMKIVGLSCVIGCIEVSTVKFRFFSVPNLAALSLILSFLGFLQFFVLGR